MEYNEKFYTRRMTPVRVIEDEDNVQIVFLESARFYVLAQELSEFDSLLALLHRAVEKGESVDVSTESIESDVIRNIKPAN